MQKNHFPKNHYFIIYTFLIFTILKACTPSLKFNIPNNRQKCFIEEIYTNGTLLIRYDLKGIEYIKPELHEKVLKNIKLFVKDPKGKIVRELYLINPKGKFALHTDLEGFYQICSKYYKSYISNCAIIRSKDLNKDDNGNRTFILCTNNENKICEDVTYPRIRNVINGYGKYFFGDKRTYEGTWVNNKLDGKGIFTSPNILPKRLARPSPAASPIMPTAAAVSLKNKAETKTPQHKVTGPRTKRFSSAASGSRISRTSGGTAMILMRAMMTSLRRTGTKCSTIFLIAWRRSCRAT